MNNKACEEEGACEAPRSVSPDCLNPCTPSCSQTHSCTPVLPLSPGLQDRLDELLEENEALCTSLLFLSRKSPLSQRRDVTAVDATTQTEDALPGQEHTQIISELLAAQRLRPHSTEWQAARVRLSQYFVTHGRLLLCAYAAPPDPSDGEAAVMTAVQSHLQDTAGLSPCVCMSISLLCALYLSFTLLCQRQDSKGFGLEGKTTGNGKRTKER